LVLEPSADCSWSGFRTRYRARRISPWCGSKEARAPNDLESDLPATVPASRAEGRPGEGSDDRGRPAQGVAHRRRDRRGRDGAGRDRGALRRQPAGSAPGVGSAMADAYLGGRRRRRVGLPVGPAAGGGRGAGRGRPSPSWPLASGCWPPERPTRTIPTTPARWPSPPCAPRRFGRWWPRTTPR
jgi:hypothetical protein